MKIFLLLITFQLLCSFVFEKAKIRNILLIKISHSNISNTEDDKKNPKLQHKALNRAHHKVDYKIDDKR